MKNSTLIFRLILLIGGILIAWFFPLAIVMLLAAFFVFGAMAYFVWCILEVGKPIYGNKPNEYTIIPKKYNLIAIFIDWINSFPPIIKKKDFEG